MRLFGGLETWESGVQEQDRERARSYARSLSTALMNDACPDSYLGYRPLRVGAEGLEPPTFAL